MGIKDLLKHLQPVTTERNIAEFKGLTIAIDASGWLHKALFASVEDFIDSNMFDSQLYVDFIIMRVTELRGYGVNPVLVFDGKRSYMKAETNNKREETRQNNLRSGKKLLDNIRVTTDRECISKLRSEAISCFQRGLGVTHEMEKNTIAALRKLNIAFVVSPYEADVQLVHLCDIGLCQAILTEDSDVLVYTAVCGKSIPILYKFDKENGKLQCINLDSIINFSGNNINKQLYDPTSNFDLSQDNKCCGIAFNFSLPSTQLTESTQRISDMLPPVRNEASKQNEDKIIVKEDSNFIKNIKLFSGMNGRRMFVQFCVLAGCDYIESIPSVGINTAIQIVVKFQDIPNNQRLQRIVNYFKSTKKVIPNNYLNRLLNAEALFHYQCVYNPITKAIQTFIQPNLKLPDNINTSIDDQKNDIIYGPIISEFDLLKFGNEKDILLESTDQDIDIISICRGYVSIKDFTLIKPVYPWDNDKLKKIKLFTEWNNSPMKGLWKYRSYLMSHINQIKIGMYNNNILDHNINIIKYNNKINNNPYFNNNHNNNNNDSNKVLDNNKVEILDSEQSDNKMLQENFISLLEKEIIEDNKENEYIIDDNIDTSSYSQISLCNDSVDNQNESFDESSNSIVLCKVDDKMDEDIEIVFIGKNNISLNNQDVDKDILNIYDYYISPTNTPDNSNDYSDNTKTTIELKSENTNPKDIHQDASSITNMESPVFQDVEKKQSQDCIDLSTTPIYTNSPNAEKSPNSIFNNVNMSNKKNYSKMKRKYDIVAVPSNNKKSNKKAKNSTMLMVSIKSFFTQKI